MGNSFSFLRSKPLLPPPLPLQPAPQFDDDEYPYTAPPLPPPPLQEPEPQQLIYPGICKYLSL